MVLELYIWGGIMIMITMRGLQKVLLPYNIGDSSMSELNLTHSNGNKVKLTTPDTLSK